MNNISSIIRSIRNIMRKDAGLDGDAQRISQMVWMLFLKIFADKEQGWINTIKDYKSPIPNHLKWDAWAADKDGITGKELISFIDNELFPTLKNIDEDISPQAKIIKAVFEDTYNYMKRGELFREVIDEINKIDFTGQQNSHVFNDIYEAILKELQSAGSSGEYYTPRGVTQFIVEMVNPQLGEIILDPACGTGGFLTSAIKHIRKQDNSLAATQTLQNSIRGVEKKPLPYLLCTTSLMLQQFDVPSLVRGNMLERKYDSWLDKELVDLVLSNPPFGGLEEDYIKENFPKEFQTKETADLFLALIIKILKDKGRAGVVLPDGSLFGDGVKTRIKEELINNCNLHTIIRLPKGVFNPYTSIKTNILFFEKGKPTTDIWYYELPYPDGVKSFNKTRPIQLKDFDIVKSWWNNREENEYAWQVTAATIKEKNYDLDIKNPHVVEYNLGTPEELLAEYLALNEEIRQVQNKIVQTLTKIL